MKNCDVIYIRRLTPTQASDFMHPMSYFWERKKDVILVTILIRKNEKTFTM